MKYYFLVLCFMRTKDLAKFILFISEIKSRYASQYFIVNKQMKNYKSSSII